MVWHAKDRAAYNQPFSLLRLLVLFHVFAEFNRHKISTMNRTFRTFFSPLATLFIYYLYSFVFIDSKKRKSKERKKGNFHWNIVYDGPDVIFHREVIPNNCTFYSLIIFIIHEILLALLLFLFNDIRVECSLKGPSQKVLSFFSRTNNSGCSNTFKCVYISEAGTKPLDTFVSYFLNEHLNNLHWFLHDVEKKEQKRCQFIFFFQFGNYTL